MVNVSAVLRQHHQILHQTRSLEAKEQTDIAKESGPIFQGFLGETRLLYLSVVWFLHWNSPGLHWRPAGKEITWCRATPCFARMNTSQSPRERWEILPQSCSLSSAPSLQSSSPSHSHVKGIHFGSLGPHWNCWWTQMLGLNCRKDIVFWECVVI